MIAWLRRLHSRWTAFADTPQGKRWLQYVRYGGTLGIAVYLVYRLSTIGWTEIGAALPRTPWFYVLFGVLYLIQPITQALIYQIIWPVRALNLLPATLVKRVYDRELLNYSGDVYLYIWARNRQIGRAHV